MLPGSRELAWLCVSKSSRIAAESSRSKLKLAPEVFNGESLESAGIMTGAGTPEPRPEASFGTVGREMSKKCSQVASARTCWSGQEEGKRRKGECRIKAREVGVEERRLKEYGERFSGEWRLGNCVH